jgi:phage-related protein
LEDLRRFPEPVQDAIGYALYLAQCGAAHPTAKRLRGALHGLVQVAADLGGSTYRAVYTAWPADAVYVLHVCQKKSTRGISTPRHVVELIERRAQAAREHLRRTEE